MKGNASCRLPSDASREAYDARNPKWMKNFITEKDGMYTAWDETQTWELGTFKYLWQAKQAIWDYCKVKEL